MSAGIYVHLPYCASRCGYCAFVVTTDSSSRGAYLDALEREADVASREADGVAFDSIYLGGGTPSLLTAAELSRVVAALRSRFRIAPGAEITLEANPEDVAAPLRDAWVAAGVNRVSVGVQSFSDRELSAVGRRHDAAGARRALAVLSAAPLALSGDLILGLPEQTQASFRGSLEALVGSGVGHVSVYLLETEKSKSLEEDRRVRPERYLSDDAQADSWLRAGEALSRSGFEHYEISNWARPGREARHNVKYWRREDTLGLGVAAHELWRGRRRANVSAIPSYVERARRGERPLAFDRALGRDEEETERLVLGLRLSGGVAREEIEGWIARAADPRLAEDYLSWREAGLLRASSGRVAFTERGFLLSNEVLCRFA